MSGLDGLKTRVGNTLVSQAAQQIDFEVSGIRVDAKGFFGVRAAIFFGGVELTIGQMPDRSTSAMYSRPKDQFVFSSTSFGDNFQEKATIIHESVHAMNDLRNLSQKTYVEDEAAAFIAEMLYYRYATGDSMTVKYFENGVAGASHETKADAIAASLLNTRGATVPKADADELQALILAFPGYSAIRPSDLSGANGGQFLQSSRR